MLFYWWFRCNTIIWRIEGEFIPHKFGSGDVFFFLAWRFVFLLHSLSIYNVISESGITSLSEALKVNSLLTTLNLTMFFFCFIYFIDQVFYVLVCNYTGDSGATSLSEALKVNSSLTELLLGVNSFWMWFLFIIVL